MEKHKVQDIFFSENSKLVARYTLVMPDGFFLCVPVNEGESAKEEINKYVIRWYELRNKDPKKYEHFDIHDKCPKCGGPMRCKLVDHDARVWCIDPNCGYRNIEEGPKVRERIYEKHGLKTKWVNKSGSAVILSNRPIKRKNNFK